MKTKAFDCVEMKRRGSKKVYDTTKDMAREEEVAYWRKCTQEMRCDVERRRQSKDTSADQDRLCPPSS